MVPIYKHKRVTFYDIKGQIICGKIFKKFDLNPIKFLARHTLNQLIGKFIIFLRFSFLIKVKEYTTQQQIYAIYFHYKKK